MADEIDQMFESVGRPPSGGGGGGRDSSRRAPGPRSAQTNQDIGNALLTFLSGAVPDYATELPDAPQDRPDDHTLMDALFGYGSGEALQSWMEPADATSRLAGSLIAGQRPTGNASIDPLMAEALEGRGVNPILAQIADLALSPDPTGAGRVRDLVPLLGLLPFLRGSRKIPTFEQSIREIADDPDQAGSGAFMDGITALQQNLAREVGVDGIPPVNIMRSGHSATIDDGAYRMALSRDPETDSISVDTLVRQGDRQRPSPGLMAVLDLADATGTQMFTQPNAFRPVGVDFGPAGRPDTAALRDMYNRLGFEPELPDGVAGTANTESYIRRPGPLDQGARSQEARARRDSFLEALEADEARMRPATPGVPADPVDALTPAINQELADLGASIETREELGFFLDQFRQGAISYDVALRQAKQTMTDAIVENLIRNGGSAMPTPEQHSRLFSLLEKELASPQGATD